MIVVAGKRPSAGLKPREGGFRVGGNVQNAKLVQHIRPIYPVDAEREGMEGTVLFEAVISQEGEPIGLKAINIVVDQRLVSAAIEAVRLWRYKPMLLNGKPIEVVTTISVVFRLP